MTSQEYKEANNLLWSAYGNKVTESPEISEILAEELRSAGVTVSRVGRKPRSRNKYILFDIEVFRIKGLDMMFLTDEEAQAWHSAKNRSLRTLMKAPEEAFGPVETEKSTEMIWWTQAFSLAHRLGKGDSALPHVLKLRGRVASDKFGL